MKRFLPNHDEEPKKWSYGWHMQDVEKDYSNHWDSDLHKGGDKATEGYYPSNEEGGDKNWANTNQRYTNYGPWSH